MDKKTMLQQMRESNSEFVTYGDGDLGMPIERLSAIADIEAMDDENFQGDWYDCDCEGNVII